MVVPSAWLVVMCVPSALLLMVVPSAVWVAA
jgi:hypothetical protein